MPVSPPNLFGLHYISLLLSSSSWSQQRVKCYQLHSKRVFAMRNLKKSLGLLGFALSVQSLFVQYWKIGLIIGTSSAAEGTNLGGYQLVNCFEFRFSHPFLKFVESDELFGLLHLYTTELKPTQVLYMSTNIEPIHRNTCSCAKCGLSVHSAAFSTSQANKKYVL